MRHPYLSHLLRRIASQADAFVELEPEFGFVGEIVFNNGRRHPFRNTNMNVNLAGSVAIAEDKGYTSYLLRRHGLRVPAEVTFFADKLRANLSEDPSIRRGLTHAEAFAREVGFPIVVKPNRGSQGDLVCICHSDRDIEFAATQILAKYSVAVAQEYITGRDYRIVVLAGEVVSAYERVGLTIHGDGLRDIAALLTAKRNSFPGLGRPNSEVDPSDFRIDWTLQRLGLTRDSVLKQGESLQLLPNANLSTGGEAEDITESIHPEIRQIAANASTVLGLTLAGVDIICQDATRGSGGHVIIEVNGAPGMDNYASMGRDQERRVEEIYLRILRFLRDSPRQPYIL